LFLDLFALPAHPASMMKRLKARLTDLRAALAGWLAVALLAPVLLGFVPQPVFTPAELALRDAALCSQSGKAQQTSQHQHGDHDRDCPCCLPTGVAGPVGPMAEPVVIPQAQNRRLADLDLPPWQRPVAHPHATLSGIPRGPPEVFI
jgi:hypothetical protein